MPDPLRELTYADVRPTVWDEKPEIMPGVPRYTIQQWVDVIIGRRAKFLDRMLPEFRRLLVGLVDQLSAYCEHTGTDPRLLTFGEITWNREGIIVIKLYRDGAPVGPVQLRYGEK